MGALLSQRGRRTFSGRNRSEWIYGSRPQPGQIVRYEPMYDGFRPWTTDGMDFVSLATRLRSADSGIVSDLLKLNEEMEAKDGHVQAMANTRRLGLTGLEWDIEAPDEADIPDGMEAAADEAAQYCREKLTGNESFDRLLENMADAIGPNLSSTEIVWEGYEPGYFLEVPIDRLWIDYTRDKTLLIQTGKDQRVPALPGKFVTHVPKWNAGAPFRRTITSAVGVLHLIKQGNLKDWAVFAEIYGMPVRVGYYSGEDAASNRAIIEAGLAALGTDAYAMIPEGTRIELIEAAARNSHPYGELHTATKDAITILYLGQTLTTDVGAVGSKAAAVVHNYVRRDLTENDARVEERTIRGQLFAPMIAYKFPGRSIPLPRFVRRFRDEPDRVAIGQSLETGARLGLRISRDTAHEMLGIPEAPKDAPEDRLLKAPAPAPALPFGLGGSGGLGDAFPTTGGVRA